MQQQQQHQQQHQQGGEPSEGGSEGPSGGLRLRSEDLGGLPPRALPQSPHSPSLREKETHTERAPSDFRDLLGEAHFLKYAETTDHI